MLSDLNYSTLPFDMPTLLDPIPSTTYPEEDPLAPLNFDDLLDIAREFEFTRTITHIWPCEEEPSTFPETGLDDILAAIVPTPNVEESPLHSAQSMTLDPVHVQEVDLHRSATMTPASDVNASISRDPARLSKDDDQARGEVEPLVTSILRGWSPPNGSQFLDLDDSFMLPQLARDVCIPPWLATFLAPFDTPPASSTCQSPAMALAIGDMQQQTGATESKVPPVNTTDKTADDPIKKCVPLVPLPMQPSTRAILEPVRAQSALQINSNVPHTKTPKSRPQLRSIAGGASTTRYAKAPRGGIPPHIARTVTKANILLVEKERKVIRNAFSSTIVGEGKKPSVLRRLAKVERETGKIVDGSGGGKKLLACSENEQKTGRAAKRARV